MSDGEPGGPAGAAPASARQVHQAVTDLVSERGYGNFTVGEVAARAGVADTSVYRRWGNLEALLTDVALTRLNAQSPMPDTGSLAGDLRTYAANVAREITGPDGLALLRLAVALSSNGQQGLQARDDLLRRTHPATAVHARSRPRTRRAPARRARTCWTTSWPRCTSASCSARARSPRTTSTGWSTDCYDLNLISRIRETEVSPLTPC